MQRIHGSQDYGLLLITGFLWGLQYYFIEITLTTMPPMLVGALRMLIGGITLSLILLFTRRKPQAAQSSASFAHTWGITALVCLFEAIIPSILLPYGQQRLDSSVAAIIMGTIPIFTIIIAGIFVKGERWRIGSVLSVMVGFLGLVTLFAPQIKAGSLGNLAGQLCVLGVSVSFALAIILIRYVPADSPVRATRRILMMAAVPLVAVAFVTDKPLSLHYTWQSIAAIIMLGVFCSGIVYLFYLILVRQAGPIFTSLVNYIVPLVGAFMGVVFLNEPFYWYEIAALVLIFSAMLCIRIRKKIPAMVK